MYAQHPEPLVTEVSPSFKAITSGTHRTLYGYMTAHRKDIPFYCGWKGTWGSCSGIILGLRTSYYQSSHTEGRRGGGGAVRLGLSIVT